MGTDIHLGLEIKRGEQWEALDVPVHDDRNYTLFGVLADVRNGTGFAGVVTGIAVPPISQPRGLPKSSNIIKGRLAGIDDEYSDGQGRWLGDHSFSWLMLNEVLAYDWAFAKTHIGTVSVEEYKHFKEFGRPNAYCGDCSGPQVVNISPEEMDRRIVENDWVATDAQKAAKLEEYTKMGRPEYGRDLEKPTFYTRVSWKKPLGDSCADFLKWARELAEEHDPSAVRLVFGFDS